MGVDRYRMLTDEQQAYVLDVLSTAYRRCRYFSERAANDARNRPRPFGSARGNDAFRHASNAGALKVVQSLLVSLGQSGGKKPPQIIAKVCDDCSGNSRVPCACLPVDYDDVAELVGQVDCGLCCGDGDHECLTCIGRGAVITTEAKQ